MRSVTIIDLDCGNIASVEFALERAGARVNRTQNAKDIQQAERLILPGVGAAGFAMKRMQALGLVELIRTARQPLLGICLGMQLLFERTEEGDVETLGLIPGEVRKLSGTVELPVPHMGWSDLAIEKPDDPIVHGLPTSPFSYFVHSYACPVTSACVASCEYSEPFAAIVQKDKVYGCQFHPERSAKIGSQIIENFLRLPC